MQTRQHAKPPNRTLTKTEVGPKLVRWKYTNRLRRADCFKRFARCCNRVQRLSTSICTTEVSSSAFRSPNADLILLQPSFGPALMRTFLRRTLHRETSGRDRFARPGLQSFGLRWQTRDRLYYCRCCSDFRQFVASRRASDNLECNRTVAPSFPRTPFFSSPLGAGFSFEALAGLGSAFQGTLKHSEKAKARRAVSLPSRCRVAGSPTWAPTSSSFFQGLISRRLSTKIPQRCRKDAAIR